MALYESVFKEDSSKFEQFRQDTGLLDLDENQFISAITRLEELLKVFEIAPEKVREVGVLLTKLKDGNLSDEEESYFYNLIGNYFKESYKLLRYFSKFREVVEDEKPEENNIILMPLIATFIKNGFLSKISVANQPDFERIKDEVIAKKGDILKIITDNPSSGIQSINASLLDGLSGSSYANNPVPTILPGDDPKNKPIADSEWFSKYATEDIVSSLAQKVEDNKFEFSVSLTAPQSTEEGQMEDEEAPPEGGMEEAPPEGEELPPEEGGDEGMDDLFGGEPPEEGGEEAPPEEGAEPEASEEPIEV